MAQKVKKLHSKKHFLGQIVKSVLFASAMVIFSLLMGVAGYHYICRQSWIDALLNASMILTGMGPVNEITNNSGKLFASFYALYSGVAFLTTFAVFISPLFHRFLHKFHLDMEEEDKEQR